MIIHTRTMGTVELLDSLLMVHPWQHANGYDFGVYFKTNLENDQLHAYNRSS